MLQRVLSAFRWFYRYRSIRLTPEGARYVLLTLAVGVAAINTGNNLLYLLLAMLLSLIVMSGLLSEQSLKQLDIRRRLPEHLFANRPARATLSIANRKPRLPTFSLYVMDVVDGAAVDRQIHLLHVPPHSVSMQTYPLTVTRRGRYEIEGIRLQTRFPFGLFLKAATLPNSSATIVYPEIKSIPLTLGHELLSLGYDQTTPRRGPGVALYNLRGYQTGDDSRMIHWKTSARQAQLIVRETEAEDQRHVVLAVPTAIPRHAHAAFEQAMSLTASLATFFMQQGYVIRLLLGDQEIPFSAGEAHYYKILRALALCQPMDSTMATPATLQAFQGLRARTALGELTLAIMSWPDPAVISACQGVARVLLATDYFPTRS